MSRDPRHTVRTGRHIAWQSAWATFGQRNWRWFVYGRFAVPTLVAAGIAVPVVAAYRTIDTTILAITMIVFGAVVATIGGLVGSSMRSVRSRMRGGRSPVPTALILAGLALIALGVIVLAL